MYTNYIYIIVYSPVTFDLLHLPERERYLKQLPLNRPDKEGIPLEEFKGEIFAFLVRQGWIERNIYWAWKDKKNRQFILYIDMIVRKNEWFDSTLDNDRPNAIGIPDIHMPGIEQWIKPILSFPKDETKYVFI